MQSTAHQECFKQSMPVCMLHSVRKLDKKYGDPMKASCTLTALFYYHIHYKTMKAIWRAGCCQASTKNDMIEKNWCSFGATEILLRLMLSDNPTGMLKDLWEEKCWHYKEWAGKDMILISRFLGSVWSWFSMNCLEKISKSSSFFQNKLNFDTLVPHFPN